MIMDFHRRRVLQCRQAINAFGAFGVSDCCIRDNVLEAGSSCDREWYPEFAEWEFEFEFAPNEFHTTDALTWEEVVTEIDEGRPFIFGWIEAPPTTHMLVAIGYTEVGGDQRVVCLEPLADATIDDPKIISFRDYNGSSGWYPHQFDYYGIAPYSAE
jgi:hypothetical protein